jgi:hypothetical protein
VKPRREDPDGARRSRSASRLPMLPDASSILEGLIPSGALRELPEDVLDVLPQAHVRLRPALHGTACALALVLLTAGRLVRMAHDGSGQASE